MEINARYYVIDDLPEPGTEKAEKLTETLMNEFVMFRDARQELFENVLPACDAAFAAKRELPEGEGIDWVDTSDRGCTDVRDAVRAMSQALALGLLPRDDTALQAISTEAESQADLNDIRDLLISKLKECDLRGQIEKHCLQILIRGTSVLWVTWNRKEVGRKYDYATTVEKLLEQGADDTILNDPKAIKKTRFREVEYNAPEVKVLDMNDVYLDPVADVVPGELPPIIIMTYRTKDDLEDSVDLDGNKLYDQKLLDELALFTNEQILSNGWNKLRLQALDHLGINPNTSSAAAGGANLIPVLIFYRPVRKFDGEKYFRTFFEVAMTSATTGKLIRAYENPNPAGKHCIFIDTFEDWISGTPYGTGVVEHALPALAHKNVVEALAINAQIGSVFPAVAVASDALMDERTIKIGPAAVNLVRSRPQLGLRVVEPLIPALLQSAQAGLQNSQWFGQKILSASGVYGAVQQDPTKNITDAKTATQINVETTSGSTMRDNLLERITTRTLEPLVNRIYEYARLYLTDDTSFERMGHGGQREIKTVSREMLDKDRKIVVVGYHGVQNKARELEELREILATLMQGNVLQQMPQLMPVVQETLFKLLGRLGVKNLDEYKKDPAEIILNSPVGQQMLAQAQQQGAQMAMQQMQSGGGNVVPFPGGPQSTGGDVVATINPVQSQAA